MRPINQNVFAWVVGITLLVLATHNAYVQNATEEHVVQMERTIRELRSEVSTLREATKKEDITPAGSRSGWREKVASARVTQLRAANPDPTPLKPIAVQNAEDIKQAMHLRVKHDYGGNENDPEHVGGFKKNDTGSWEPLVWNWLIHTQKITSLVDVGCGSGLVPNYFHQRGVDVTCVEGSNDGVLNNALPGAFLGSAALLRLYGVL